MPQGAPLFEKMRCGGKDYYGAGISSNITKSSLRAIVTAINKILMEA